MEQPTGIEALKAAYEMLGSQQAVAEVVGVKQPSVHKMLTEGKKVPGEWCLPIERATEGKITRYQLRPDLYPIEETQQ